MEGKSIIKKILFPQFLYIAFAPLPADYIDPIWVPRHRFDYSNAFYLRGCEGRSGLRPVTNCPKARQGLILVLRVLWGVSQYLLKE